MYTLWYTQPDLRVFHTQHRDGNNTPEESDEAETSLINRGFNGVLGHYSLCFSLLFPVIPCANPAITRLKPGLNQGGGPFGCYSSRFTVGGGYSRPCAKRLSQAGFKAGFEQKCAEMSLISGCEREN